MAEIGLDAVLKPELDRDEARRQARGLQDELSNTDVSLTPDLNLPDMPGPGLGDLRSGAARATGRAVGRRLPGRIGTSVGGGIGEWLAGSEEETPEGGGGGGTSASEPDDAIGLMSEQLAVQEEILEELQRGNDPGGGDGNSRLPRAGLLGMAGGVAAGSLLALSGVLEVAASEVIKLAGELTPDVDDILEIGDEIAADAEDLLTIDDPLAVDAADLIGVGEALGVDADTLIAVGAALGVPAADLINIGDELGVDASDLIEVDSAMEVGADALIGIGTALTVPVADLLNLGDALDPSELIDGKVNINDYVTGDDSSDSSSTGDGGSILPDGEGILKGLGLAGGAGAAAWGLAKKFPAKGAGLAMDRETYLQGEERAAETSRELLGMVGVETEPYERREMPENPERAGWADFLAQSTNVRLFGGNENKETVNPRDLMADQDGTVTQGTPSTPSVEDLNESRTNNAKEDRRSQTSGRAEVNMTIENIQAVDLDDARVRLMQKVERKFQQLEDEVDR